MDWRIEKKKNCKVRKEEREGERRKGRRGNGYWLYLNRLIRRPKNHSLKHAMNL